MNLNTEIKLNFLDKFLNLFRGNKWEILESKEESRTHYQTNSSLPGEKLNERKVKTVIALEKCSITGKTRGFIYYGRGSLFDDEEIPPQKAKLIIDGKL